MLSDDDIDLDLPADVVSFSFRYDNFTKFLT